MDERKMRLYRFLLVQERITMENIPEPYKTAIQEEKDELGDG